MLNKTHVVVATQVQAAAVEKEQNQNHVVVETQVATVANNN